MPHREQIFGDESGNDHRLDAGCQQMLKYLDSRGGSATTGELRAELFPEKNPSAVHSRMENHYLVSEPGTLDLVEITERRGANGEKLYSLTDNGREFVDRYREPLADAVAREEAIEVVQEMREQMDEWDDDVQEMREHREKVKKSINAMQSKQSYWKGRIEDAEAEAEAARAKAATRADADELSRVERELSDVEEAVEELQSHQNSLSQALEMLRGRIESLEHEVEENRGRTETLRDMVNGIIEKVQRVPVVGRLARVDSVSFSG